MKRFILTVSFFLGAVSFAQAEAKPVNNGTHMPDPGSYSSEAVYITSSTCASGTDMIVSNNKSLFYAINVTTPSGAGGYAQLHDSRLLSSGRTLTNRIETVIAQPWGYNVGASSGMVLTNVGGACLDIIYMEVH